MDELIDKLIKNSNSAKLTSIETLALKECAPVMPQNEVNFKIINLSNQELRVESIDSRGLIYNMQVIERNLGSILILESKTNLCFALSENSNLNEKKIIFKIPENLTVVYYGDLNNLKQMLNDSTWSTNLNENFFYSYSKLISYKEEKNIHNSNYDHLIHTSYYDDSLDFLNEIERFMANFNATNKFVDPFFNPLDRLSREISLKRVSDLRYTTIYNDSVLLKYTSRQGQLGDCWLLRVI